MEIDPTSPISHASGSKAERELLKAIFRLTTAGSAAHTSDVAECLGVTPGTVTVGVKRLAERGLVVHRPYKGVELTPLGHEVAVAVIRRHRIVERFLADYLGYSWKEADALATSFEHQIPDDVEQRLFSALGRPDVCPHGFPIPERNAERVSAVHRLVDLEVGARAVVAIPGDVDVEVVEYLDSLGVRPGAVVEIRDRQPFDGPMTLHVEGSEYVVGNEVANNIHVVPGSPGDRTQQSRTALERSN